MNRLFSCKKFGHEIYNQVIHSKVLQSKNLSENFKFYSSLRYKNFHINSKICSAAFDTSLIYPQSDAFHCKVLEAKQSELKWVIKRAYSDAGHEDECCVRLRGLPWGCSKDEILQFFSGLEIVPNGITMTTDHRGRDTGEAFVQFINKDTTEKAMEKHKERIAHRYIEIFQSNLEEVGLAMKLKMFTPNRYNANRVRERNRDFDDEPNWRRENDFNDNYGGRGRRMDRGGMNNRGNFGEGRHINSGMTGHCVHMRGLPFQAIENDITDFFHPLIPVKIKIRMNDFNRPSGNADVEFATHDAAVKAMAKDREYMQHRFIELFLNSTPSSEEGNSES